MTTYSYFVKPQAFYVDVASVTPAQPMEFSYGDTPVFRFSFLPNAIQAGDTLVYAADDDMIFYSDDPGNILHSASCMIINKHVVTEDEAAILKVEMPINTRTIKFRDTVNGKIRPVDVMTALYVLRDTGDDKAYSVLAKGRGLCNAIIADYDSLPEPITTGEYYTKDELDALLAEKAEASALQAHTDDADIHVTLDDKSKWDSKADIQDITDAVDGLAPVAKTGSYNDLTDQPVLATVATTGSYNDLTDKPAIPGTPEIQAPVDTHNAAPDAHAPLFEAKQDKIDADHKLPAANVDGLATVATTGSYNDLSDQPTIPEANDPKISLTQGGVEAGSFTLNQATPVTIELGKGGEDRVEKTVYAADNQEIQTSIDGLITTLRKYGPPEDTTNYFHFASQENASTIRIPADSSKWDPNAKIEWSKNRRRWHSFKPATEAMPVQTVNKGESLWLRGDNNNSVFDQGSPYRHFELTGSFKLGGKMNSLWNKNLTSSEHSKYLNSVFWGLNQIIGYQDDFALPDNVVEMNCTFFLTGVNAVAGPTYHVTQFQQTYDRCYNLEIPEIPRWAENAKSAFYQCSSLKKFPELYQHKALTNIDSICAECKGVTESESNLYEFFNPIDMSYAFWGCKDLVDTIWKIPENATSVEGMYGNCSSLVTVFFPGVPENCKISRLFTNCTSLKSLPDDFKIPASAQDHDSSVFEGTSIETLGNNVQFLDNALWEDGYYPISSITTIGDNFVLTNTNVTETDPFKLFPELQTLGTNCSINSVVTNPA